MNDDSTITKDKLVADFRAVVADAEELLRLTANQAGERVGDLRSKLQDHLQDAKVRLGDAEAVLTERTRALAHATDDYVHENPWRSVGIAAGAGLIIGLLLGRR